MTQTPTPPPLRLAILEADTPQPKTNARYGGYRGLYTSLLANATHPQPVESVLTITGHDIVADPTAYPTLDSVDAILISGSRHNAFDSDPWILALVEYTRAAIASGRVRVIGVCFGHQIVGRALGARVERNSLGWELAVTQVELNDEGKKVFQMEKMRIQQMHLDYLPELPANAHLLGSSSKCAIQSLYLPRTYITVQGHPEFTCPVVTEVLEVRRALGRFPDDDFYNDALRRAGDEHDGVAVARAFLRFLRE